MPDMGRNAAGMAAAVILAGCAAAEPAADPATAIRARLERWAEDFNARRAPETCDLFAADVIASYQGQPERGYEALCALLTASLGDPRRSYRYDLKIEETIVSGDLAVVRLVWRLTVEDRAAATRTVLDEPGLDVFRRQPDGSWKIIRYLAYQSSRASSLGGDLGRQAYQHRIRALRAEQ